MPSALWQVLSCPRVALDPTFSPPLFPARFSVRCSEDWSKNFNIAAPGVLLQVALQFQLPRDFFLRSPFKQCCPGRSSSSCLPPGHGRHLLLLIFNLFPNLGAPTSGRPAVAPLFGVFFQLLTHKSGRPSAWRLLLQVALHLPTSWSSPLLFFSLQHSPTGV